MYSTDESEVRNVVVDWLREKTEDTTVDVDDVDDIDDVDEAVDALELVLDSTVTGDSLLGCCRHGHFRDFCEVVLLTTAGSSRSSGKGTCRATGLRDLDVDAVTGGACLPSLRFCASRWDAANVEKSTLMRELGRSKASGEKESACAIATIIVVKKR